MEEVLVVFGWLFVAYLVVLVVAVLLWCSWGVLLRPQHCDATIVLQGSGDGHAVEQAVRAVRWLWGSGFLEPEIQIVDCGLNEDGIKLAQRLASEPAICLITKDERREDLGTVCK